MRRRNSDSEFDSDDELIRLLQLEMATYRHSGHVQVGQSPGMSLQPVRRVRETPQRERLDQLRVWDDMDDLFNTSREVPMPRPDKLVAYGEWLRGLTVFTSIRRKEKNNQRLTRRERLFKFSSLCALWMIDRLPEFESLPGLFPDVASSEYELAILHEIRQEVFKEGYFALFHFVKFTNEESDFLAEVYPLAHFSSCFEIFLDGYERLQAKIPRHGVPELPEDFTF